MLPEQEPDIFEVEEILQHSVAHGTDWYLVHWKGYDNPEDNTWEPIENLTSCLELVSEFVMKQQTKETPKKARVKKIVESDDGFEPNVEPSDRKPDKKSRYSSNSETHSYTKHSSAKTKESPKKVKRAGTKNSAENRVKSKPTEVRKNSERKVERVEEALEDDFYTENDPVPAHSVANSIRRATVDPRWRGEICEGVGIGWKIKEILSAKRNAYSVCYECLFENGLIRWINSSTAHKLNAQLVADFLSVCIDQTMRYDVEI